MERSTAFFVRGTDLLPVQMTAYPFAASSILATSTLTILIIAAITRPAFALSLESVRSGCGDTRWNKREMPPLCQGRTTYACPGFFRAGCSDWAISRQSHWPQGKSSIPLKRIVKLNRGKAALSRI
ncbi:MULTISPECIES: hypothetical protein [unclassified Mesorhizobium]|uniref:hypothetical protein n=1 Tax=Mesorhizobium sp. Root1471 TaxID=1736469 RepID=UPI001910CE5C